MEQHIFNENLKKIGMLMVNNDSLGIVNSEAYKTYIKVLYISAGCKIKVDFKVYITSSPSLFFISPNQILSVEDAGNEPGYFIFYNVDFYCIQIHDKEVACDGLLYNNIHNMPMTTVPKYESEFIDYLFARMEDEFIAKDCSQEEMIRTYLKQIFIRSTRLWKLEHLNGKLIQKNDDTEFFRYFTQLVEANYKKIHNVTDYAGMMSVSPKTLTHKFKRMNLPQPNEIIKNRIILEAKRLLAHTCKTSKEIAYDLGYEDPAYFSRFFYIKTGETPSGFKNKYLNIESSERSFTFLGNNG